MFSDVDWGEVPRLDDAAMTPVVVMPGHYMALWSLHVIERICTFDP